MAVLIFALLGSVTPAGERTRTDEVQNGLFSMIAFLLGATTSILCGYLGMKIATYANARTAVEARKGIAPAFMCGECWDHSGTILGVCCGMSCGSTVPQLLCSYSCTVLLQPLMYARHALGSCLQPASLGCLVGFVSNLRRAGSS